MASKKLIEVALPLEAINSAAAHEKSVPRRGHPATLHLWWARRPLAACRAVLFASLVDDPSSDPTKFPTEEAQETERQRLFRIIEELVKWENSSDEGVLGRARAEILRSTGGTPPPVLDPFCGGGSIPLEAQRLGLETHASDLNPIAVLITKALIEIPPKFAGRPPVNPEARRKLDHSKGWRGAQGLACDVRHYGRWMRDEAAKRIGHLYPKLKAPEEQGGGAATVIAWLWARTVRCPNPACGAQMPLVSSFALSGSKAPRTWIRPDIDRKARAVRFEVSTDDQHAPEGTVNRKGARCILCESPVPLDFVRKEGRGGRMGACLLAIAAESSRGRIYLAPTPEDESIAATAQPANVPETELPARALGFRVQAYGMTRHRDLFTPRQLVALTTFSDLVGEAHACVRRDARAAGLEDDGRRLTEGGVGTTAYADAVATYLAFAVDKLADWSSTICTWIHSIAKVRDTFSRQALPMTWDFAEVNPLSSAVGNFLNHSEWAAAVVERAYTDGPAAAVIQRDAVAVSSAAASALVCTDPPYYDNIGYADLSDFFYVWARRSLARIYPDLFATLLVPKQQELIASPFRFDGDRARADRSFEEGLGNAFDRMRDAQYPGAPLTLFYAFKQAETTAGEDPSTSGASASTGWETMLEGLLRSGFSIVGTWPIRTERGARSVGIGTNALASSIVLVARPRPEAAPLATRKELLSQLKSDLPLALKRLQHGNIAPVDLAQAAIGPGMAVYSRYSKVVEADGSRMPVRTALGLINQILDEVLAEQESEFDRDTRFALTWFEQRRFEEGPFGEADVLARARDTAVNGLQEAGIVASKAGKVRLLRRDELPEDWNPATDRRLTIWEMTHHLIRRLESTGEASAADLLRQAGGLGDVARDLAYRLYNLCERKGWAQEATVYNSLVTAWPELIRLASQAPVGGPGQGQLFGGAGS